MGQAHASFCWKDRDKGASFLESDIRMANLEPQTGQLLIIGFDGTEMSPRLASLLARVQPAGVILFARNIISPEQTYLLLRECQKHVPTPLFTCVDLEGASVD